MREATGEIRVQNESALTQTVSFSALDIKSTDESGNVQFLSGVGGVGSTAVSYVTLATQSAILAPGAEFTLKVSVQNTQNLSPGGHYSAVVARFSDESVNSSKPQVYPAVSTLLLTRKIGGERYHISLSAVRDSERLFRFSLPDFFELTFANDGNIHVVPYGTVHIRDLFGRLVKKGIVNESSSIILPQNRRTLRQDLYEVSNSFPIMLYSVTIEGTTTPGNVPYARSYSFIYLSARGFAVLFIFIALLLLCIHVIRRRRRKK